MTREQRLKKLGEYTLGRYYGQRRHCGMPTRELVLECWRYVTKRGKRNLGTRKLHDARHAFYRGAIDAHAEERALMRKWRL